VVRCDDGSRAAASERGGGQGSDGIHLTAF
jgi:hypothetical protein